MALSCPSLIAVVAFDVLMPYSTFLSAASGDPVHWRSRAGPDSFGDVVKATQQSHLAGCESFRHALKSVSVNNSYISIMSSFIFPRRVGLLTVSFTWNSSASTLREMLWPLQLTAVRALLQTSSTLLLTPCHCWPRDSHTRYGNFRLISAEQGWNSFSWVMNTKNCGFEGIMYVFLESRVRSIQMHIIGLTFRKESGFNRLQFSLTLTTSTDESMWIFCYPKQSYTVLQMEVYCNNSFFYV